MIIRTLFISLFFFAVSKEGHASSPTHFATEHIITLLEGEHLNWLSSQKKRSSDATEFEFILRRQTGYEAPRKKQYTPEIKDYSYSPNTKHFKAKLVFTGTDAKKEELAAYPLEGFSYPLQQVPVSRIAHIKGNIISADDIELLSLREDHIQPYFETDVHQLVGMEVTTSIQPHKPISKHHIKPPRLIQKGEFVDISINNGAIQLSAQGKALQAGGKGELISVMNSSSKKIIQGKVIAPGQVRIIMRGKV